MSVVEEFSSIDDDMLQFKKKKQLLFLYARARDRQTDRQTDTVTDTDTDTETERQTDRKRETETEAD